MTSKIILKYVNCALCGEDDTNLLFVGKDRLHHKDGQFKVVKCKHCGLIYTNPRPTKETIKYFYPSDYYAYQDNLDWKYIEMFSKNESLLSKFKNDVKHIILKNYYRYSKLNHSIDFPIHRNLYLIMGKIVFLYFRKIYYRIPRWVDDGKALDFGCGNGAYLLLLKKLGWNVVGVDTSSIYNKALLDNNIPVLIGDLDEQDLDEESFDVITMWNSLEHTHQPTKALKKARNLLKDGGLLYIEVPNSKSFIGLLFKKHWFAWDLPRHLYHFSPNTLRKMLIQTGFEDIRIYHLRKNTIPKSLTYWCEYKNLKYKVDNNGIGSYLIKFLASIFSVAKKGEIILAISKNPK